MSKIGSHSLQTLKVAVKILSHQYNTHRRYTNSVLGNLQSSVTNSFLQDCKFIFTSSATNWTDGSFDATLAQSISNEGNYIILYQTKDEETTLVVM